MRTALFWSHIGPYHLARFGALRSKLSKARLVELADNNMTYGWKRSQVVSRDFDTLFPGVMAESVSAVKIFLAMRRYLVKNRIDTLYVPSFWPAYAFSATMAALSVGSRIVFMTESHEASGRNRGLALLVKQLLLCLYDSALVGGSLHRCYLQKLGMSKARIFDGYDVIDNAYFEVAAAKARQDKDMIRISQKLPAHYFLSLGRFVEKKNLMMVIRAYGRLVHSGRGSDYEMVFVGAGVMEASMVAAAKDEGLSVLSHGKEKAEPELISKGLGGVHFYPFAQIDVVPSFYALASAFVLASTTEEWGLVINEAMASGCPTLVSSAVGCAPDLVEEGKTGYIFDPHDVDMLSECMARICGDDEHVKVLGRAAQVKIADWSCERFGKNALLAAQAALGDNAVPCEII